MSFLAGLNDVQRRVLVHQKGAILMLGLLLDQFTQLEFA